MKALYKTSCLSFYSFSFGLTNWNVEAGNRNDKNVPPLTCELVVPHLAWTWILNLLRTLGFKGR